LLLPESNPELWTIQPVVILTAIPDIHIKGIIFVHW
jgi:hypothetical protein